VTVLSQAETRPAGKEGLERMALAAKRTARCVAGATKRDIESPRVRMTAMMDPEIAEYRWEMGLLPNEGAARRCGW